ncbi:MAG: DNA polymerase III subunit delta [Actinobacteria bacterium]|nr:MAG: DNA polymerase III subunit delta [Actinomycetota bacterium]
MTPAGAPVHLVWGEDPFLLRLAALEIFGQGVQPREIEAGDWQGGETADLSTPSLFGEPRALLVTDARHLPEDASRELAAYLAAPSPDATLVLSATVGERGRVPAGLVKLVQPIGEVREVKVARKDLPAWVGRRAKAKALELAPDASSALVERLGEDPATLDQALDQLGSAFAGTRVTRQLVAEQFRGLGDQHVWDLCDRAFARDLPGAMRSLATLLQSGEDALPILGGIASRLRDLVRVGSLPDRMPPSDLARAAGLRFEWQARRYRESARRFSMEELVDIHDRVVEADRALKSGATGDVVLPALVLAITGERALAERT